MANKNILIVSNETGNEPEALRQTLEWFGYTVVMKYIGRPNDFIEVLENKLPMDFDYIIIDGHGDGGAFCMPELGEDIYTPDEYRYNISHNEIKNHLKLSGKTIISLACTSGYPDTCKVFSEKNTYIAPVDYVEGNASAFFAISLFYQLSTGKSLSEAFDFAKKTDEETGLFVMAYPK